MVAIFNQTQKELTMETYINLIEPNSLRERQNGVKLYKVNGYFVFKVSSEGIIVYSHSESSSGKKIYDKHIEMPIRYTLAKEVLAYHQMLKLISD